MAQEITRLVGDRPTVGLERLNAGAAIELNASGCRVVDAQYAVEMARAVKSAEELKCVKASLRATENGVGALRAAIKPGLSDNAT
jgi:Xaa-Pro aminopeptidase